MPHGVELIERNGRFVYRAVPWDKAKRKKGKSRTFLTESKAIRYKLVYETEGEAAALAAFCNEHNDVPGNHVLLGDYAMKIASRLDTVPNTRSHRQTQARRIAVAFPNHSVAELTRAEVMEFLARMREGGLAPGTVRGRLFFLRKVMFEARMEGLISADPTENVKAGPNVYLRAHRPPDEKEVPILLRSTHRFFWPAIYLALDSGLRCAEIAGLRWFRIDLDAGTVHVRDVMERSGNIRAYPKGRKARTVPLSDRTVALLREIRMERNAQQRDHVLLSSVGRPLDPKRISTYWTKYIQTRCVELAEPRPTFHDLRHGFAHRAVASGMDIHVLSALLGHGSLEVTKIYMPDVSLDTMVAAMQKVKRSNRPSGATAKVIPLDPQRRAS